MAEGDERRLNKEDREATFARIDEILKDFKPQAVE
jgi:hypothetical protein